jgi:hypothetical protein
MQRAKRLASSTKVFPFAEVADNKSDSISNFDDLKIPIPNCQNRISDLSNNNYKDISSICFDNVSLAERSNFGFDDDFMKSSVFEAESFKNEEPTPSTSRKLADVSILSGAALSQISPVYPVSRVVNVEQKAGQSNSTQ